MTTIFVAGASGAVGRFLVPLLRAEGWRVVGLTRRPEKSGLLVSLGAEPLIADVFDRETLLRSMEALRPQIVVHQLTDLPQGLDPALMDRAAGLNARIRDEGTGNLVAAALHCGADRLIAQSVAFAYAAGPLPYSEKAPLAVEAEGRLGVSARGVASLERQVLAAPLTGLVLRYGKFYGPGTGFDRPPPSGPVHVEAAARAAALAITRGNPGIYNVAEDDGTVISEKAKQELGWSADMRCPVQST